MKIQCDVCNAEEAFVFCSADEAALCNGCDQRVHHANKLASKHERFSLLRPSSQEAPPCDICQERRAFLFCKEDRAILCQDCDLSIHSANEHTQKHNRFLLTGVRLSLSSAVRAIPSSSTSGCDFPANCKLNSSSQLSMNKPVPFSPAKSNQPAHSTSKTTITSTKTTSKIDDYPVSEVGSTSSISEYLMEMLPGWRVEDLLESTSATHGLCNCKQTEDLFEGNMNSFFSEDLATWVPQAMPPPTVPQYHPCPFTNGFEDLIDMKMSRKGSDDGFTVPQISPSCCIKEM